MPSHFFSARGTSSKIIEVILVAAGFSLFAAPAKAGFQWVAPAEQAPAASGVMNSSGAMSGEMPPMMPAPSASVMKAPVIVTTPLAGENPEVISPIVIEGRPLAPSSSPVPSMAQGQGQFPPLGSLPAAAAPDMMVQGFANNVPLAVALREILPPGFGFSIDQDVDLGTLVSFQGGRPWRDTLMATLAPVGLGMREQNEMVAIGRTSEMGGAVSAGPGEIIPGNPTPSPQMMPMPQSGPIAAAGPPVPLRPNMEGDGPRPTWTQPSVKLPPAPASPPPISSSRISSASVVDTWTATRGQTLHKTLEEWSRRAGAEFEWSAEYDYPLQASISFTGTFEEAVRSLLSGFEDAHPQPVAELHANPGAGQMVLVVQTRGNSYTD